MPRHWFRQMWEPPLEAAVILQLIPEILVLMKSDLNDVYKAIALSHATIRNIKQNLFWAFFYNSLGIPLAAGALYAINGTLLNPIFAGLAMSLSSVTVVGNALRLRKLKL